MANRLFSCGTPSTIQSALKILCRQCSELACANIMSSTSVGIAAERAEARLEVVDLVGRERQARAPRWRARAPRGPARAAGSWPAAAARSARTAAPQPPASGRAPPRSCGRASAAAVRARSSSASGGRCLRTRCGRRTPRSMRDDRVEAAVARDVGGLRRPRRDRARPRHDEQLAAVLTRGVVRLRSVGEELLERVALARRERTRDLDEVDVVAVIRATR